MAPYSGLPAAHEAIGSRLECCSGRGEIMLTIGLCVAAAGMLAVSLESTIGAWVLFGLAGFLLSHA